MSIRIEQLRYFLHVADTRSVNQSAASLFISPQGLSRSIASLEKECGVLLFDRSNSGMVLTEEGRRFRNAAREAVMAYDRLDAEVYRLSHEELDGKDDVVHLVVSPLVTIGDLLSPIIEMLASEIPDLRVETAERNTYEIITQLESLRGEMESSDGGDTLFLGTIPDYRMGDIPLGDDYDARVLLRIPIVARMRSDHPLAERKYVTKQELAREKLVCFNEPVIEEITHHLLDDFGEVHFAFTGSIRNLIGRFPDAVSLGAEVASLSQPDFIASVPIRDSICANLVLISPRSAGVGVRMVRDCIVSAMAPYAARLQGASRE